MGWSTQYPSIAERAAKIRLYATKIKHHGINLRTTEEVRVRHQRKGSIQSPNGSPLRASPTPPATREELLQRGAVRSKVAWGRVRRGGFGECRTAAAAARGREIEAIGWAGEATDRDIWYFSQ